jgi:hypothetical protein
MGFGCRTRFSALAFLVLALPTLGDIDSNTLGIVNQTFPQLNAAYDLTAVYLGGQNFTVCCLKAIYDALDVSGGQLQEGLNESGVVKISYNNTNITSVTELLNYTSDGQFPCGAKWNGNPLGAPKVDVQYDWFMANCPGWQVSSTDNLDAWLLPLSAFILPAIIFCLSVPRRRKLGVPRVFFQNDLDSVPAWLLAPLFATIALVLVSIDTIIWLSTCFALAGPMILSGLYEALIDQRVLDFVRANSRPSELSPDMRCRCLMTVLVGNLDLMLPTAAARTSISSYPGARRGTYNNIELNASMRDTNRLLPPHPPDHRNESPRGSLGVQSVSLSPWTHMEELLRDIRRLRPGEAGFEATSRQTQRRLRTMLYCQASFGSMIGAPIIFFIGTFLFTLETNLQELGNKSVSQALAFGQWYMIIPHIAIISGLLLAGNNPNILEGVFASSAEMDAAEEVDGGFPWPKYELAYPSCYRVAWQWLRGPNKRLWIDHLTTEYGERSQADPTTRRLMEELGEKILLSNMDWLWLLVGTAGLVGVPLITAFLTEYFTPVVGVSCRCLTFTVYGASQATQIILWLWAYDRPAGLTFNAAHGRFGSWLEDRGFYQPADLSWLPERFEKNQLRRLWSMRSVWCLLFYVFSFASGAGAVFSALGGTVMQLLGVYSYDICSIRTQDWLLSDKSQLMVTVSDNAAEMIEVSQSEFARSLRWTLTSDDPRPVNMRHATTDSWLIMI